MPLPLAAFAAGAAAATGALVRAAQVGALDEGPEYIRDGEPDSPLDAVGLFAARQACKVYANNPNALNDRPAAAYERVCRPFLDNIGYGEGPSLKLPFQGGQCYGVQYRVTTAFTNPPIGPQTNEQLVSARVVGTFRGSKQPNQLTPVGIETQQAPGGEINRINIASLSDENLDSFRIQSIVREGGGVDDCGNPAPDYEEPVPPDEPETGPKIFVFAPNFEFEVDVNLDVDGRISIDIGTGPIVIDPFGDDGDGGENGGGEEDAPGAPEPGPELPGGNGGFGGDDAFGAPPAGKRWVGACIRIVTLPQGAGVIPQSVPDDVYPTVVGNIRLVGSPGGSRLTDTPIQVRAKHVCVWEPVRGFNPTGVSVDLLPGYGYTYRPYAVPEDN